MLAPILAGILTRDLRALRREVEAYSDETDVWRVAPGLSNSTGTLVLHLAGNLQHFVGGQLGGTGYVRDRNAEFSLRDLPRHELLARIDAAVGAVERGLASISDAQLAAPFPQAVGGVTITTADFLVHLAAHLGYHLGQVDYHRRILTGNASSVGALSVAELRTAKKLQP
jgi:hypothetical protein